MLPARAAFLIGSTVACAGALGCAPGPSRSRAAAAPAAAAAGAQPLYYSDLGPDAIDVSNYPVRQKYNYQVYAAVCARCHTLARSINAPVASRGYWEMYMLGMRAASRLSGAPITKQERTAILDFLEFDSRARKIEKAEEFDALTEELKRRYAPIFHERLRRLQDEDQPRFQPRP